MAEIDPTENIRRLLCDVINNNPNGREALEATHGQIWDTQELQRDYTVKGFMAPFVVVERKSDGKLGSLSFQHSPRFYWGFVED